MKLWKPTLLLIFFSLFVLGLGVNAQEVVEGTKAAVEAAPAAGDVIAPPTAAEISKFLEALGGAKGLGTLGIIALIVQGLMLLLKSTVGKFAGVYQLLAVNLLTLITGIIGLKMSGMDWGSAILHSQSLAAFQVFLHQAWKQFQKKDTAAA